MSDRKPLLDVNTATALELTIQERDYQFEQFCKAEARIAALESENERLKAERDEAREVAEAANRPFMAWVREREERAVQQARSGQHVFLQDHDDETSCCLRCLCQHPDAGQGCIEYKRADHAKASGRAQAAEARAAKLELAMNGLLLSAAPGRSPQGA